MEEFAGMVSDIGANKGVLVCPAGFTSTAKKRAKRYQIELYRPVDTDDHKWRVKPAIPTIFEYISAGINFNLSCSYPGPLTISNGPESWEVLSSDGRNLGRVLDIAMDKWNSGKFPVEAGEHADLPIFEELGIQIDNGHGGLAPVEITANLQVTEERYFGQLSIDRVSGFLDEQTGMTITNSFSLKGFDFSEIQSQWQKLNDGEEPPIKAVIAIRGLNGWYKDEE